MQQVRVVCAPLLACFTCPICKSIFREATTVTECLHTFCRICIYKELKETRQNVCPACHIDLGVNPFEKLRSDYQLAELRNKLFPLANEVPSTSSFRSGVKEKGSKTGWAQEPAKKKTKLSHIYFKGRQKVGIPQGTDVDDMEVEESGAGSDQEPMGYKGKKKAQSEIFAEENAVTMTGKRRRFVLALEANADPDYVKVAANSIEGTVEVNEEETREKELDVSENEKDSSGMKKNKNKNKVVRDQQSQLPSSGKKIKYSGAKSVQNCSSEAKSQGKTSPVNPLSKEHSNGGISASLSATPPSNVTITEVETSMNGIVRQNRRPENLATPLVQQNVNPNPYQMGSQPMPHQQYPPTDPYHVQSKNSSNSSRAVNAPFASPSQFQGAIPPHHRFPVMTPVGKLDKLTKHSSKVNSPRIHSFPEPQGFVDSNQGQQHYAGNNMPHNNRMGGHVSPNSFSDSYRKAQGPYNGASAYNRKEQSARNVAPMDSPGTVGGIRGSFGYQSPRNTLIGGGMQGRYGAGGVYVPINMQGPKGMRHVKTPTWVVLQSTENPSPGKELPAIERPYLRVRDPGVTIGTLQKYVEHKLNLNPGEVVITCRNKFLESNIPLMMVQSAWFSTQQMAGMNTGKNILGKGEASLADIIPILNYQRR